MIKRTHQKQFRKILTDHPLENLSLLSDTEAALITQRKYICKMPSKGTDVIHLLSGGVDSISSWGILMEEFGLRVHPVCINTGQKRHDPERRAVELFSQYYKERYPKNFVEPFHITFPSSAPEISKELRGDLSKTIHPHVLINHYDKATDTVVLTRKYLFSAYFPFPAALAAVFFDLQRNLRIRTIFCSILPEDGIINPSQTLTSLRAATLALCAFTNERSWQVISVCFEPEFGLLLHKPDLIRWSYKHHIPIEKTYTCQKGNSVHCGECTACKYRRESFTQAGVPDKTVYRDSQFANLRKSIHVIKHMLKPLKPAYQPLLSLVRRGKRHKNIYIKDYY